MRKSGIITLLLAILGGLTGYVIASGTFASYFDSQNRIKDSIVLQNMKENMLVDISLANRDELEKKIDSYLNDPAFFDVEGIFVERKGGSRFLLSRFKDDLVEKNVQSTLSEILSNPAPMKGSFSRPGKENSIIYYVHRREIPARNILPGKVSRNNAYTFGFIKNNSYAQIRQNNFAMTIGWIVSGTVMLISFLFNIVSTYRIDEEKENYQSVSTIFSTTVRPTSRWTTRSGMRSLRSSDCSMKTTTFSKEFPFRTKRCSFLKSRTGIFLFVWTVRPVN